MTLLIAIVLWCVIMAIAVLRRIRLGRAAGGCIAAGLTLLVPAAGQMHIDWPVAGEIVVMVDLSPSTRTAGYRDRATLQRRIHDLLDDAPQRIIHFADTHHDDPTLNPLPDLPADQTRFTPPPDAAAILLFSDGQFEPPSVAPPIFAVIDPDLMNADDGAITDLRWIDGAAVATVKNEGDTPRRLTYNSRSATAPPGRHMVVLKGIDPSSPLHVRLDLEGDAWPENNALSIAPPPPAETSWWWISLRRPPPSPRWTAMPPAALPASAAAWLNVSVVAVDNIPAAAILLPQAQRIQQYARDLGGRVLILGGDRAFAAGGYAGTPLDAISPLAAHPPRPARHWLILTDVSGSMDQPADGSTRLQIASAAVIRALHGLPDEDLVTVGGFSQAVGWWIEAMPVDQARRQPLPPPDLHARGPTNLQPALRQLITAIDPNMPTEAFLLTDGQATLDNPDAFIEAMRERTVRLHLLATGSGDAIDPLERIVTATGGHVIRASDPGQWVDQAQTLARQAMPDRLMRDAVQVAPVDQRLAIEPAMATEWNRTWLRDDATLLATARYDGADVPMIARWRIGSGIVVAAGYLLSPATAEHLADAISTAPRDPRFTVRWDIGSSLRIVVDAIDEGDYLNDLPLTIDLAGATALSETSSIAMEQVAPGRYTATLPAPRQSVIATLRLEDNVIERRSLAGRYAPEFDAIGVNRSVLAELAQRSGGRVIEPDDHQPLDLPAQYRRIDPTSVLAAGAFALIGIGLLLWRRG